MHVYLWCTRKVEIGKCGGCNIWVNSKDLLEKCTTSFIWKGEKGNYLITWKKDSGTREKL